MCLSRACLGSIIILSRGGSCFLALNSSKLCPACFARAMSCISPAILACSASHVFVPSLCWENDDVLNYKKVEKRQLTFAPAGRSSAQGASSQRTAASPLVYQRRHLTTRSLDRQDHHHHHQQRPLLSKLAPALARQVSPLLPLLLLAPAPAAAGGWVVV